MSSTDPDTSACPLSECDLDVTVDSIADLVVVVDQNRRVVECNGAPERVWGLTAAEVVGLPLPTSSGLLEAIDRDGQAIDADAVPTIRALDTGHAQRAPTLGIRRPDGTITWTQVVAFPLIRQRRVVSVWTDITASLDQQAELARMNVELERRVEDRTAKLEASIAELEAFSYSVSHDLRSPVRAISTLAEALQEELAPHDLPVALQLIDRILGAAGRMDDLIATLLELAKAARAEPRVDALDLSALARDEVQRIAERFPDREIEVVIADRVEGFGDARLIGLVLHNLLTNAWKFSARVEAPRIEFGVREPADGMGERAYFVRDNGIGFDMTLADDIFVPFRRLHTAGEFEGTGVGLAIVHRLVTRHGGRVWAESSPGQGATFFLTLPRPA